MNRRQSSVLLKFFFVAIFITFCRGRTTESATRYVEASSCLAEIQQKTCRDFQWAGDDCLLRLRRYVLDQSARSEARIFANLSLSEDAKLSVRTTMQEEALALEEVEAQSIRLYTGKYFAQMNGAMRGSRGDWDKFKGVILAAASGLHKLENRAFVGMVFRTENIPVEKIPMLVAAYQKDAFILERSFISATTKDELKFSYGSAARAKISYVIHSKSGVDVSPLSNFPAEKEVLFAPGAVFKVDSFAIKSTPITLTKFNPLTQGFEKVQSDVKEIRIELTEVDI